MAPRTLTAVTGILSGASILTQLVLTDVPDVSVSNRAATAFYQVASHRSTAITAFYVAVVAAVVISVFAHCIIDSSSHVGVTASSTATLLPRLASTAATGFVTLSLAGAAAFAVPSIAMSVWGTGLSVPFAETMSSWGEALLMVAGPVALAGLVAALSALRRQAGQSPAWLTYYGYLTAVALLASMLWLPLILAVTWFLTVGIHAAGTRRSPAAQPVLT